MGRMSTGHAAVARWATGVAALAFTLGLAGCGTNPIQQSGEVVASVLGQVDEVAVQVAATQAMTAVLTYTLSNQHLPASLAEAGFPVPAGVEVQLVPAGGIAFSICAKSGDHAYQAENGSVTAVASC